MIPRGWLIFSFFSAVSLSWIAYDIFTHGSFNSSYIGKTLHQYGVLAFTHQAWMKVKLVSWQGFKWAEENVPIYLTNFGLFLQPYFEIFWNWLYVCAQYVLDQTADIRMYVNKRVPEFLQWLTDTVPPLTNKAADVMLDLWHRLLQVLVVLWASISHYSLNMGTWLQEHVFTFPTILMLFPMLWIIQDVLKKLFRFTTYDRMSNRFDMLESRLISMNRMIVDITLLGDIICRTECKIDTFLSYLEKLLPVNSVIQGVKNEDTVDTLRKVCVNVNELIETVQQVECALNGLKMVANMVHSKMSVFCNVEGQSEALIGLMKKISHKTDSITDIEVALISVTTMIKKFIAKSEPVFEISEKLDDLHSKIIDQTNKSNLQVNADISDENEKINKILNLLQVLVVKVENLEERIKQKDANASNDSN